MSPGSESLGPTEVFQGPGMGCGASQQPVARPTYNMVLVNLPPDMTGEGYTDIPSLELYSLKGFKLMSSFLLEEVDVASQEYSILAHPKLSCLLFVGETSSAEKIWKMSTKDDTFKISTMCGLPSTGCTDHLACICSQGSDVYVYLLTNDSKCFVMNLESRGEDCDWSMIGNLPIDMTEVGEIFSHEDIIAFVTVDFDLISVQTPSDLDSSYHGDWEELFRCPFPRGLHCTADGVLYCVSEENQALFSINLKTGDFNRVKLAEADIGIDVLQRSQSMAAIGNVLYFSGYHYMEERMTVIELDLNTKKCAVVGYFDHASPYHRVFITPSETSIEPSAK